ncbi:hypothetical protein PTI98_011040 [Pleurotus ostreatus]|nr:hypothetical protein PTI98_011040 [Pleurotus ostreatus]
MTKSTDVFHPLLCSTWLAMARAPEGGELPPIAGSHVCLAYATQCTHVRSKETLASLFSSTRKMATTQSNTESTYTAITYIGCRGPIALSKTTFKVFKSRCPVRAIVFIEGFEDAGYPIDSLHKAIAKRDTEATPKPSTNCFANLGKKKKAKSMANPPMIFFSEPTTNVEIRLYVTDKDEEKLLAQTKVPLSCLDGDVKVSWTSPELLGSLKEDPVMTFKRTTHSEFDSKLTSIGDLPPINSIFLATFANLKRFIGVGKALSELTTPAGKVIIGLVEAIALECDGYVKRRESVTGLLQTVGDACMLVADWDNRKLYQHRPNQTKVYQYVFPAVYRCLYFVASLSPTKIAANLHDLEGEIKRLQGQLGTIMQRLEHSRDLDMQEMLCDILHIVTKIEDNLFVNSLPHADDAGLDPSKSCADGTREAILTHIQKWVILPGAQRALLLYGVAGKGKSAIIHTVSRALGNVEKQQSSLANVAFFAFNRSVANRSIDKLLLTWAWGLASRDPHYLRYLRTLDMEHVKGSPLDNQVKALLIEGLKHADSHRPIVFVIDALDECLELRPLLNLLDQIFSSSSDLPQNCRFLFTCRPNADILVGLDRSSLIERISLDDEQWLTVKDIHIFVHEKLGKWPDVAHLVNRVTDVAEGLFQCAALLCAELTGPQVSRERFIRKLEVGDFNTLYGTYEQVLEAYIDPQNELRLKAFKHLMASIFLVRSPQHRDTLLPLAAATLSRERQSASKPCGQWSALQSGEERSALESILPLLGSLLSGSTFDANEVAVLPLHTSFRDFLVEPVKVPKGPDFSVDIGPRHQELLALACLDITNAQLRFNMCGFDTSYALNSEIDGFQERAKKLDPELKYACQCAAYHLDKSLGQLDEQVTPTDTQKSRAEELNHLRTALSFFLKNRFLYWLEIHSYMKSWQDGPGGMLPCFQKWASLHLPGELVSILADFIKFEKRFRNGYMLSAPQLYYSGLTFSPEASKVRQLYETQFCIPITVTNGREKIWPPTEPLVIHAQGQVTSVAFSPDGAKIVSGSCDKTIRIWDAATGQQVGDALTGHEDEVTSVAFSPDGAQIVSGSCDKTIRIWDAATGQQVGDALTGHEDEVTSVAFLPDGAQIVSGSWDKTIRIWNAATGQQVGDALTGHEYWVTSVAFSPDGAKIVSGSCDKTIRIWDAATGQQVGDALTGHEYWVTSVAFSPDGAQIVSGSYDNTIRIWDAATGQQVGDVLTGHDHGVISIAISPGGTKIMSGAYDKTIRIWDAATGQQVGDALTGYESRVTSVAFSPDGAQIVSGSYDNTIRIWDVATGQQVGNALTGHESRVTSVAFSPEGMKIVSGSYDKTIRIWDAATGQQVGDALTGHESRVTSVAFSPDGAQIVSGSYDNTIRIWDAATGQQVGDVLTGHDHGVISVAFSPGGTKIVSGAYDKTIRIWDAATGQQVGDALTGHEHLVSSVAFSPDGAQIVSGSYDKTIRIWDVATGQQVGDVLTGHEDEVTSVAFSPDGAQIVSGSYDNTIRIWDAATRRQLQDAAASSATGSSNTAKGHGSYVHANDALYKQRCPPPRLFFRRGEWLYHAGNQGSRAARILWIPPVFRNHIIVLYPCLMVMSTRKRIFLDIQDIAVGPRWKDIKKAQAISS